MTASAYSLEQLVALALQARQQAYAPYSHFLVGAALLTRSQRVFVGANVENASYGLSICAERGAVMQAIVAGEREFKTLVVVTENGVTPCGACRQVLAEFAPDLRVVAVDLHGQQTVWTMRELLPAAFGPQHLAHRG